ncbi:DEAD/DEAH box helicase [Ancylobacter sp. MQZ15Z-1]|uniref:DEAD/DEAH box helicase n=1 Tax=Ancylobacter mangrovi TaxID=2972472 RepID=A0A9X2PMH9_9HYPH|nr:DEAD/DEAH box helicase [Ancylobacter mangrovi]MCS0497882.1 DEAD/DEAH box helicase [Ancylobacter mangrovi]
MYGTLHFDGERWVMSGLEPHVAIKLKAMFPGVPKASTGPFTFPDGVAMASDLEWFLHRYPMEMAEADRARMLAGRDAFTGRRNDVERIFVPDWTPPATLGFQPGRELYRYQAEAAEVVRKLGRLLLLDDVGLGKTVTALGALTDGENLPAAIVVQPHLRTQWKKEYVEKFTTLRAHIIQGTQPYDLPEADLYLFSYSNIAGWVDVFATGRFRAVVYDEIQELRTGTSTAKGQAAAILSANTRMRIGLTATPVYNYGPEMFHVVEAIEPGALGTYEDFLREWCSFGGRKAIVKEPDALGTYLREIQLVLRRERAGGNVNTIPIEVDYDEDVEADSLALMRTLASTVVSGSFAQRGQAARELDIMARMVTGLAKAKSVAAYVRLLLNEGLPVLLAGWHREVYDIWGRELGEFDPVLYTGSETPSQKDRAKAAFINGDTNLMMISLRSGAGLDGLQQRCSHVVFGELDWSPKVHEQVIGRLDRPGQSEQVTAIFLHANGGSDPLIVSMLGLKASQAQGIVDPGKGVMPVLSDGSRIRALAERFLQGSVAA